MKQRVWWYFTLVHFGLVSRIYIIVFLNLAPIMLLVLELTDSSYHSHSVIEAITMILNMETPLFLESQKKHCQNKCHPFQCLLLAKRTLPHFFGTSFMKNIIIFAINNQNILLASTRSNRTKISHYLI